MDCGTITMQRTAFDRAACAALAPHARYYPCNETLRPLFYTGTLWHARDFAAAPVLLLPQGNYPLKNLHTVIKALPAVLAEYGDAELRIAGWPPLDKGPLLRPVIDRMFPYKLYCKRLAAQLGVTEHIRYTGPLDAAAMRQAYLEADVFLLPSGKRPYSSISLCSFLASLVLKTPGSARQHQLPPRVDGVFMRDSCPRPSRSCACTTARSAALDQMPRIMPQ